MYAKTINMLRERGGIVVAGIFFGCLRGGSKAPFPMG